MTSSGGWWTLYSIAQERRDIRQRLHSTPPQACPNDGEPLEQGKDGILYCPFDGWQYPRDADTAIR